jgi:predicted dehydrogenase
MAVNRAEMEKLKALAEAHPCLVLCEASARHTRLQPKFKQIHEIIASGELGEVYFIHHQSVTRQMRPGIEYNPTAKWFLSKELGGGGPMMDWGEYDLSFHLGLLDDVPQLKQVRAFAKRGLDRVDPEAVFDVEEHFAAFMEFDTGLTFYYEKASNAHNIAPNETRIYGTRGGLKFSYLTWGNHTCTQYTLSANGQTPVEKTFELDMSNHPGDNAALIAHFLEALAWNVDVAMPISLVAKHFDIIQRTYAACEQR